MAPKIHLVRHAQGLHNVSEANTTIHDPILTTLGQQQCYELQRKFPHHQGFDLIVSSPIKRTIYTALFSFQDDIKNRGLKIIALPELQETSGLPCDTGSEPRELANMFISDPVDFTLVLPGWNIKKGKWAPEKEAIAGRAQEAREWLIQRPEKEIVVVTHGGLLHYLTDEWQDMDKFPGTGWANTEFRSYTFDNTRPGSHLIETEDSKRLRHIKPLDHTEVLQLRRAVTMEDAQKADEMGATSHADQHNGTAQGNNKPMDHNDSHSKVRRVVTMNGRQDGRDSLQPL